MDTQMMAQCLADIYSNKYDQIHSILIYKDDLLVFEEYMEGNKYSWDGQYYYGDRIQWHMESLHMTMSVTKSITSAIIGIAVEHLLTMTSGLEWDEWSGAHGTTANDIDVIYIECQEDPLACILSRPLVSKPGSSFTYSGGNMILLGEILRNATGRDIMGF